jgi:hypothetical protein
MLNCARSNLIYKIRKHTKDGADDDKIINYEFDEETINKTDKLTIEMCEMLNVSEATV